MSFWTPKQRSIGQDEEAASPLIQAMIFVVIGLVLFPVISDSSHEAVQSEQEKGANKSQASIRIIKIIPMMYVILLLVGVSAYLYLNRDVL